MTIMYYNRFVLQNCVHVIYLNIIIRDILHTELGRIKKYLQ